MEYRPYELLNKTGLAAIERGVAAACGAWAQAWLASQATPQVRCYRAGEYRAACTRQEAWLYAGTDAGQWVGLGRSAGLEARLGALLTGNAIGGIQARPSPLLDELVRRALGALVAQLCPWADGCAPAPLAGEDLPGQPWAAGSGAAVAVLEWDGDLLELVLGPAQAAAMLPASAAPAPRRPMAPIGGALAGERLKLKVLAGEVQLELGLLQTIAVGDVIRLDTRIDQPLQVLNEDGTRLCGAFLGSADGRKSIQLIA